MPKRKSSHIPTTALPVRTGNTADLEAGLRRICDMMGQLHTILYPELAEAPDASKDPDNPPPPCARCKPNASYNWWVVWGMEQGLTETDACKQARKLQRAAAKWQERAETVIDMVRTVTAKIQLEIDHIYRVLELPTTREWEKHRRKYGDLTTRTIYKCGECGTTGDLRGDFQSEHDLIKHARRYHRATYAVLVGKFDLMKWESSGRTEWDEQ